MYKNLIVLIVTSFSILIAQSNQADKLLNILRFADLGKMEFLKRTINDNYPIGDSTLISTLCDIYHKTNDEKIKRGCALTLSSIVTIPSNQYGKPTSRVLEIFIDKIVDTTLTFNSPHIQNLGQLMLNMISIVAPEELFKASVFEQHKIKSYNYTEIQKLSTKWYLINKNNIVWDSEMLKFILI